MHSTRATGYYDALGRPSQIATTVEGAVYTFGAGYDVNGRLSQVSYPSGFVARYGYNALGYADQLSDAGAQVFWTANALDAEQHLTQQTAGNGVVTTRSFSALNGRLLSVAAGSGNAVQNATYTYDLLGNPLSRTDGTSNLSESFTYDPLNRLLSATISTSTAPVKTLSYDAIGNILSKSDVGTYTYAPPGSPRPHAVTSISGSTISTTFTYDPNGNQTAGLGRTVEWTSYNRPASITQGSRTISFLHDTDHQRVKQVSPEGTTLYIAGFGVLAELSGAGGPAARWTDYLAVGNAKVGMRVTEVASQTISLRYFHLDHLGSVSVLTNEAGVVVERLSYDAWGKRRHPNGADDVTGSIESQTTRGFTGHEQLDSVALVHMNGRVYDPLVGRMISADPTVPDPLNAQAWNRYSYVGNDPLAFADPSGFSWLSEFFHGVANFFAQFPIIRAIFQIVATVVIAAVLTAATGGAALLAVKIASAALGSAITTGLSGGKLGDMLKAAAIAGATAFAFNAVGNATTHAMPAFNSPQFDPGVYAGNVAGHAAVGCLSSAASGGSCRDGALSGAVGAGVGPLVPTAFPNYRTDPGQYVGGLALTSVAGGLASVAGGGKFENGAVTAAFGYMYNQAAGKAQAGYDYENHCITDGSSFVYPLMPIVGAPLSLLRGALSAIFGGGETTALYRAVSSAEYEQIMNTGTFQAGPNSLGGKFFAETPGAAAKWGEVLNGAGNFKVIEVELPSGAASSFMRFERLDGIGPARYGTLDILNSAKPVIRSLP
ncbi:DUF637 domain-containing protein [Rhodoplanes sp. TEM]|uniref:DUF637 domain-containing protein n=1 Tax=Rhodoplanes tepidamans TaxID=200616 RepID=A0ABT5JIV7_RHOTP|nr:MULTISPECIES: RHS repeat-associated core domain-containing protein [Rhodoplanes]MDC7789639.1 DUF637 domain-containing protein [Rhodoplanes tepidamans]MDC7987393.1 DUF637 domain-containing protein [Rhodoplanes sp. TEM]MDQ0359170.1 RHS repeat-associated protein [Rhodoplanes tepidamans]